MVHWMQQKTNKQKQKQNQQMHKNADEKK